MRVEIYASATVSQKSASWRHAFPYSLTRRERRENMEIHTRTKYAHQDDVHISGRSLYSAAARRKGEREGAISTDVTFLSWEIVIFKYKIRKPISCVQMKKNRKLEFEFTLFLSDIKGRRQLITVSLMLK